MATIVGGAIGGAVGGPVGAQIGTALGGYLDQAFLFPALFPPDPIEGPRLNELRIGSSAEGSPQRRALGAEARVGGSVIWLSPLKEVANTEDVGGKGGPGVEQTSYTYFVDVAVALCEGPPDGLGVVEVSSLIADTKTIYRESPDVNISNDQLTAVAATIYKTLWSVDTGTGQPTEIQIPDFYTLAVQSPIGGPDLSELRDGWDAVVGGFAETANNGTWRCIYSHLRDDGTSVAVFRNSTAFADDTNVGANTITIDQTLPQFDENLIESVTVYKGTEAQTPDSTIEAAEGNSPAYRGVVYVVLKNLKLTEFGNRLPQFSGVVWATGTTDYLGIDPETVGGALQKLLAWAKQDETRLKGLSSLTFDTTAVDAIPLRGYGTTGPTSLRGQIQPLLIAYDLATQEDAGTMTFFERKNAPTIAVDPDDLAAHPFGADSPRTVRTRDGAAQELPKEVSVSFVDPAKNYQQANLPARLEGGATGSAANLELPVVLTGEDAREVAFRVLWLQYAAQRRVEIRLPPSYWTVQEGDVLTWTDPDLTAAKPWRVLVQSVERGANGLVRVEGTEDVVGLSTWSAIEVDAPVPVTTGEDVRLPEELLFRVIDVALLSDAQAETPGVYMAASRFTTSGVQWPGAVLYESADDTTFSPEEVFSPEPVQGSATTELDMPASSPWLWDRANTVRVDVGFGRTLESATEDRVLAGANRALVGGEIIGFATATLVSDGVYDLSDLLRGLAGTEDQIDQHTAGEEFVLLDQRLRFVELTLSDYGVTRYYKGVPVGGNAARYPSRETNPVLANLRPLSVADLEGEQSGTDWDLTWKRRTRYAIDPLRTDEPILGEDSESYEIDVLNVGTGALVATYTSTDPSFTYTAAQQTADFGGTQSSIRVVVYQISARVGRGKSNEQTFT